jgi:hypothetical protein
MAAPARPITQRGLWRGYAVKDGNLITGQQ